MQSTQRASCSCSYLSPNCFSKRVVLPPEVLSWRPQVRYTRDREKHYIHMQDTDETGISDNYLCITNTRPILVGTPGTGLFAISICSSTCVLHPDTPDFNSHEHTNDSAEALQIKLHGHPRHRSVDFDAQDIDRHILTKTKKGPSSHWPDGPFSVQT